MTGEQNSDSYSLVKNAAESGLTYDGVEDSISNWSPRTSEVDKSDQTQNGYLTTDNMVQLPTIYYTEAYADKQTAIAWAIMVKYALEYIETGSEPVIYKTDMTKFKLSGSSAGFRTYH